MPIPITAAGAERLKAELQRLKAVERPAIIQATRKRGKRATCRRTPNTTRRASGRASSRAAS